MLASISQMKPELCLLKFSVMFCIDPNGVRITGYIFLFRLSVALLLADLESPLSFISTMECYHHSKQTGCMKPAH